MESGVRFTDSVIQGYHVYKEIQEASCGQIFPCLQETGNALDPFAVSIVRDGDIIGHVPRKISAAYPLFSSLQNRGSIKCTVPGSRQFSRDLAQGRLAVQYILPDTLFTTFGKLELSSTRCRNLSSAISNMCVIRNR